jgi:hypothetical protein
MTGAIQTMPLLRVDSPGKPNLFRIQLDGNTAARLRRYSRFTSGGTIDSITKAALTYAFDADKDFLTWEANPENLKEPEAPKRAKKGAAATPPDSGMSAAATAGGATSSGSTAHKK